MAKTLGGTDYFLLLCTAKYKHNMATIKFSVHRNPKTDPTAADTFHVRPDSYYTADKDEIVDHLQRHHHLSHVYTEPILDELPQVIVEHLLNNKAVHINGLGTFSLRLGFRPRNDETADAKPVYTDPKQITGNDLQIDGISFRPDKEFLSLLTTQPVHFENATGRGHVGHTAQYTEEQVRTRLRNHLADHPFITRRQLMELLHLTDHTARRWLERLTSAPEALLKGEKIGTTFVYRLRSAQ